MSRILGVIPSRLQSSRLPQKPLKDIFGKSLVERVWLQAKRSQLLSDVVVATDAEQIAQHVEGFGGKALMTPSTLMTGSERVYEAARLLGGQAGIGTWDVILNIQGDMPFLPPHVIDRLIGFLMERRGDFSMATIATPIFHEELFLSKSVVKVVVSSRDEGLYFSRSPIPCPRDDDGRQALTSPTSGRPAFGYKHLGLYAFTPAGIQGYSSAEMSGLERIEKLEQLRALERGARLGVVVLEDPELERSIEVDTPDDLERANALARQLASTTGANQ